VQAGGHVSAVAWGTGPPEVIFLHEAGRSARAWDEVALGLGRPSVAIDLPGHGRSGWRRTGRYEPRVIAGAIAEAIRSFAPRASRRVAECEINRFILRRCRAFGGISVPLPWVHGRGAAASCCARAYPGARYTHKWRDGIVRPWATQYWPS
jgi:pimeloyl-ACP methyl ester carboxylesterase